MVWLALMLASWCAWCSPASDPNLYIAAKLHSKLLWTGYLLENSPISGFLSPFMANPFPSWNN